MEGLLQGKVVVITGAGSGVGRESARLFARHGARLVLTDLRREWLDTSVALAHEEGAEAIGVACDVSDREQVDAAVAAAIDAFGRLDVMFNNAGITVQNEPGKGLKTLLTTDDAETDKLFDVNVRGVIYGCQAAVRQFQAQGDGGNIVITASVAGLIGFGSVVYGSTKGAIATLTRALAMEVSDSDIRVNALCPAGMLTHFAGMDPDGPHAEAIRSGMAGVYPMGRAIEAVEAAQVALFLASDLSSGMTGVNVPVDAGLSAGVKMRR